MAKKRAKKVATTLEPVAEPKAKAVRLDLSLADHERLEKLARKRGLSMASYARMVILERLDEEGP